MEETAAARIYADVPVRNAHIEEIAKFPKQGWMPIGSVEFCLAAMRHQGIPIPEPLDYPSCLEPYITCGHHLGKYGDLPKGWTPDNPMGIHAKPVQTKLDARYWDANTPFWIANWHRFGPEYRVYVCQGEILGMAQYDEGYPDLPGIEPLTLDESRVREMVRVYQANGAPAGYGLDVGVSDEDGRTLLVEVNDGWALGYYPWGTLKPREYLRLLLARWEELAQKKDG